MESVWFDGDAVGFIDQRGFPREAVSRRAETVDEVVEAIATLGVRGAPAIGIFGAYGVALAALRHADREPFEAACERIRAARPTAVNLAWAVDRVLAAPNGDYLTEARAIHEEQREIDRRIADRAFELFPAFGNVLTHCHTGALATGGQGTALGAIVGAAQRGKKLHVFVDETRPLLQGSRLTMVELAEAGVAATLIVDSAAALTMRAQDVRLVIVGADRIARNGDTANKIGTYALAILAAHHGIPFYVAAPRSTFDFALSSGDAMTIEERSPAEVRAFAGAASAPTEAPAFNPAFDVTPGHLVTAFVTEYGLARPPYDESLADLETRPRLFLAAPA